MVIKKICRSNSQGFNQKKERGIEITPTKRTHDPIVPISPLQESPKSDSRKDKGYNKEHERSINVGSKAEEMIASKGNIKDEYPNNNNYEVP